MAIKINLASWFNTRNINFYQFFICFSLLGAALYLQLQLNIQPCPLCIIQRIIFLVLGLLCFFAALHNPYRFGYRIYSLIELLIALMGAGVAGWQVWLEHQPPGRFAGCGISFSYMLTQLPLNQTLRIIFHGTGECSIVQWRLLTFSIAEWSLGFFCLFALINLWQAIRN